MPPILGQPHPHRTSSSRTRAALPRADRRDRTPCATPPRSFISPRTAIRRGTLVADTPAQHGLSSRPPATSDDNPLQYALALFQFQAPGFVPASSDVEPLVSEPVTITGLNAPGIVPRTYAPPGYVHADEGDYNTAMGYLENGNQRYVPLRTSGRVCYGSTATTASSSCPTHPSCGLWTVSVGPPISGLDGRGVDETRLTTADGDVGDAQILPSSWLLKLNGTEVGSQHGTTPKGAASAYMLCGFIRSQTYRPSSFFVIGERLQ